MKSNLTNDDKSVGSQVRPSKNVDIRNFTRSIFQIEVDRENAGMLSYSVIGLLTQIKGNIRQLAESPMIV
jgi:hypothetical protein